MGWPKHCVKWWCASGFADNFQPYDWADLTVNLLCGPVWCLSHNADERFFDLSGYGEMTQGWSFLSFTSILFLSIRWETRSRPSFCSSLEATIEACGRTACPKWKTVSGINLFSDLSRSFVRCLGHERLSLSNYNRRTRSRSEAILRFIDPSFSWIMSHPRNLRLLSTHVLRSWNRDWLNTKNFRSESQRLKWENRRPL